ncbi:hypothetical protein GCM10020255_087500 [Rhodococcus baikonurensis]
MSAEQVGSNFVGHLASIHCTIFGGIMLGIALGLGSAAVGIGLGLLGAGAGILLSDKTVKTGRRELTA